MKDGWVHLGGGVPAWPWAGRWPVWQRALGRAFWRARFVLPGALAGFVLAWLAGQDLLDEHLQVAQSVEQLTAQLTAQQTNPQTAQPATQRASDAPVAASSSLVLPEAPPAGLERLPGQQTVARVWPALQQQLSQQGLRVTSMRPLPEPLAAPLPSQGVAVHMSGRFADWQQAWNRLSAAGPVWSVDRISVVPQAAMTPGDDGAGDVQIDAVLRVWLQPGQDGPGAWPADEANLPVRSVSPLAASQLAPGLFAPARSVAGVPGPQLAASAAPAAPLAVLPADPQQWPLATIRLAGLWQQADERQAVLVAGTHAVRVAAGQRVGQEGLRVEAVLPDSVRLRTAQGALHVLKLERGPQ